MYKRRKYSPEFKREAIALSCQPSTNRPLPMILH